MKKHAYLIMAHNQYRLLSKLIRKLDYEENDIFLHLDSKWNLTEEQIFSLVNSTRKSTVYITSRINVMWGGYSQIACEMILLRKACETKSYDWYHLLTGVDYLLKPIQQINEYFNKFENVQFINFVQTIDTKRTRYYWPFRDICGRSDGLVKTIQRYLVGIQSVLNIDRNKNFKEKLAQGLAYFDINHDLAQYILSKEEYIYTRFKNTTCCDEVFLHTLVFNSKYYSQCYKEENHHYKFNHRYVDFYRGENAGAYIFKKEDFDLLLSSNCFFARKFDYERYPEVIDMIDRALL